MKVRCKKCKKNFDYSLYGGVCPKCGTYYREIEREREDDFSLFSGTYKIMEEEKKAESNYKVPERRTIKRRHHGKAYYGMTLFLIGSMVAAAVLSNVYANKKNETGKKQMELEYLAEPEIVQGGEPFTYDGTNWDGKPVSYTISLTKVEQVKSKKLAVPEGYEMIEVSYHVDDPEWEKESYEEDGFIHTVYIHMRPYLLTKRGEYLNPVPTYSIKEMMNWDYEREEAVGLSEEFSYGDGVIYYLVKENDMEALWISQYEYDEEEYREKGLLKSILIKDLEEWE